MKRLFCLLLGCCWMLGLGAQVQLQPMPQRVVEKEGSFEFSRKTWLYPDDTPGAKPTVLHLQKYWKSKFRKKIKANTFLPEKGNYIAFYGDGRLPEGAYAVRMYSDRIEVRASSEEGFRLAAEALKQLLVWKRNALVDLEYIPEP